MQKESAFTLLNKVRISKDIVLRPKLFFKWILTFFPETKHLHTAYHYPNTHKAYIVIALLQYLLLMLHSQIWMLMFDFNVLGWWFDACGPSNLNGMYYQRGQNSNRFNGIKWYYWKGSGYSLKSTTMMMRPADFKRSL